MQKHLNPIKFVLVALELLTPWRRIINIFLKINLTRMHVDLALFILAQNTSS